VVRTYKDLIVWQKAYTLILSTYRATARFPSDERFGLVFEIRKTARSIANNIAEGHLGYLPNDTLVEELGHVERLLSGLVRSLAKLQATPRKTDSE